MTSTGYAFIVITSLFGFALEVLLFYFIIKKLSERSKRKNKEKLEARLKKAKREMEQQQNHGSK